LHVEIDLSGTNLKYKTAQNLGIYVENDPAQVERLGSYLKLDLNERIDIAVDEDKQSKFKYPFPSPISIRNVLSKFCDFEGPVMKKTLKDLAKITSNEQYKQK
jgi:NADPH-ferrihemoprotein reductase